MRRAAPVTSLWDTELWKAATIPELGGARASGPPPHRHTDRKAAPGAGDMNINEHLDCCKNPRFQVNMLDTFLGCRLGQVSCPGPGLQVMQQ